MDEFRRRRRNKRKNKAQPAAPDPADTLINEFLDNLNAEGENNQQ